jgi:hypothetical protein
VYRRHTVPRERFARIVDAARRRDLALLSSLEYAQPDHGLGKRDCRRLAAEVTELRVSGELPDADDDLAALAELGLFCSRAPAGAWLTILT